MTDMGVQRVVGHPYFYFGISVSANLFGMQSIFSSENLVLSYFIFTLQMTQ